MRRTLVALILTAGCASTSGDYRTRAADPELLHDAVHDLTGVIVYDILNPPQAARVYAYASIAAYEALRPGYAAQRTLAGQLNGLTPVPQPDSGVEYYLPLSSVHAFMTVGRSMTFSRGRMDSLRTALEERIRGGSGIPGPVFERSIAYGDTVAKHILAWAAGDHYLQTRGYPKYTVTSEPGRWRPTPPAYMDGVEPHWAKVRPFVLDSASQFRPKPPHRFDMKAGSPFFREVFEVYDAGKRLTAEQRQIVTAWDDNPFVMHVQGHTMFATKKITPGGHWMGIVGVAARQARADFMRSAGAYARTAIALADGFLSCWDEKYRSNLLRPETVINAYLDERWEPALQTPPFPEYTSGHSVISTAAATVLTDEFGDGFAFTDNVEAEYGLPPRSYSSFKQAAAEAAISRLYGGIHYRMAIEEGIGQGRSVGELVVQRVRTRGESLTRTLRLDHDHAVRRLSTVGDHADGVLEDLDHRDVMRIEPGQAPVGPRPDSDPIDHVERLIAPAQRRGATNADRDAVRRPRHGDAREPAHELLFDGLGGRAADVLRGHARTGRLALGRRLVTRTRSDTSDEQQGYRQALR